MYHCIIILAYELMCRTIYQMDIPSDTFGDFENYVSWNDS